MTYALGSSSLGNLAYSYDQAGRRAQVGGSFARTGLPQALTSATYNAANEVTQWGATSLTYDLNGNLAGDGVNTYTWDARNHLAAISGGTTTSFQYDPFGRRTSKTIGGASTQFLYDGINPVQELSGGAPTGNLLSGLGVDEVSTRTDAVGARNFLTDGLGSTLALTDPSGNLLAQYTYEPFGNTTVTGSAFSPYQYTGRENDGTGLYYYRARYYDPAIGRFISEDPIRHASGTVNFYTYVGNNPIDYTDPFGLSRDCAKPKCFAQLKYRPVQDWRAKMFGRNHAFWYVQGSTGIQYILSGGPWPANGPNQNLNVWPNQDIHGGVDNVSTTVWWDSGLSADNCKGVDAMIAAAQGWPQNTIPCHPVEGPNSDTAAHNLGMQGGFNPPAPPGTMGWNTPIPH